MSLEQQVANLVEASNNLTKSVDGKISEIDKKIDDGISRIENQFINVGGMTFERKKITFPRKEPGYAQSSVTGMRTAAILLFPNDTGQATSLKHVSGTIILARGSTGSSGLVGYAEFVAHRGYNQFDGNVVGDFGYYKPYLTDKFDYNGVDYVALLLEPQGSGGFPSDGVWLDVRYRFHESSDAENLFKIINPVDETLYSEVFNPTQ